MDNSTVATENMKLGGFLRHLLIMAGVTAGYLLLSYLLIGFRIEQVFLISFVNLFYFISKTTRKFLIGFSIFIIYWVIFDYMKALPNYMVNDVHIESLYNMEKSLFGIAYNGTIVTPNEYLLAHASTVVDVISGFFYLSWIPVPLIFGTYMFYKNRPQFFYFALTFLFVNLLGFVVYYTYPAAPPWYVQQYGFDFQAGTPGNTAGLARFDAFFGVSIFKSLYEKGSNVFAAMPSLHSAYPLIVFFYGVKNKLGWANVFFGIVTAGIWFAAVYTSHHYILDVVAGIICAMTGILLFEQLLKVRAINNGINALIKQTL